jgi:dTDP-4-amino-4,6-dideoxy-D-glucose acyltransferase
MDRFYDEEELRALRLANLGKNVRIDRSTILIHPQGISVGDNSRIDAFGLITAAGRGVTIGRHVHIAAGVYIYGAGGVMIEDFAGISSRTAIYSTNDDYSGEFLTGPTIPTDLTNVTESPVRIGRHVVVGAGSIILPGVQIGDGAATGALTLVRQSVEDFELVAGNPLRVIRSRSQRLLELEKVLNAREGRGTDT